MELISNDVIYHDGKHNAFTSMTYWHEKYWLVFRNGENHRSHDGKIKLIYSSDLKTWSSAQTVIDSEMDDRDPTIFICNDKLFVASISIDREWKDENDPFGGIKVQRKMISLLSCSCDGKTWSTPKQVLPDHHAIWWTVYDGSTLYATVRNLLPSDTINKDCYVELWKSNDGFKWDMVSIISNENKATEIALTFLPDKRLVAFVRHDEMAPKNKPEIKIAFPPYQNWRTVFKFDFLHNGPCIGQVNDKLVTASRAFFEEPETPLIDAHCQEMVRGIILGVLDPNSFDWTPALTIPHHKGPRGNDAPDHHEDAKMNFPDMSYASIIDLADNRFAMSFYEGYKGPPSDIRLAILEL